jgi:hypothetical protein
LDAAAPAAASGAPGALASAARRMLRIQKRQRSRHAIQPMSHHDRQEPDARAARS